MISIDDVNLFSSIFHLFLLLAFVAFYAFFAKFELFSGRLRSRYRTEGLHSRFLRHDRARRHRRAGEGVRSDRAEVTLQVSMTVDRFYTELNCITHEYKLSYYPSDLHCHTCSLVRHHPAPHGGLLVLFGVLEGGEAVKHGPRALFRYGVSPHRHHPLGELRVATKVANRVFRFL